MNTRNTLLLAIAGALLAGSLVSSAISTVEGELDDSPMTIPVSRVGDRVAYANFVTYEAPYPEAATVTGGASATVGPGLSTEEEAGSEGPMPLGIDEFFLEKVTQTLDRDSRLRDVLLVASTSHYDGFNDSRYEYVDLVGRESIRIDTKYVGKDWARPDYLLIATFGNLGQPIEGLNLQGLTLRLGDDVTEFFESEASTAIIWGYGFGSSSSSTGPFVSRSYRVSVTYQELVIDDAPLKITKEPRAIVAHRAVIDGRDAYGIRTEMEYEAAGLYPDQDKFYAVMTQWVSGASPYPVLFDFDWGVVEDGERKPLYQGMRSLAEFVAGNVPVTWGTAGDAAAPTWERERGSAHPRDGTASRLPFSLSSALGAIGPLSAPRLTLWANQNPGSVLVGAELRAAPWSQSAAAGHVWHLVYAVPAGQAYEVSVERSPAGLLRVVEHGETKVPKFQAADLPDNAITIAASERAWSRVATTQYQAKAPNFVQWGFPGSYGNGVPCPQGGRAPTLEADPRVGLKRIYVGHSSEGSCVDTAGALAESALIQSVETGRLFGYYEIRDSFGRPGTFAGTPTVVERQAAATHYAGIKPPKIESAALVSSSLLAVFLAAYFLPALKFIATKGAFAVPLYAKLKKEELLDNRVRDQILQVVRNDPGITTTDLARRVDAGWGTVVYHLGVLEKNKMVSGLVDGRYHRFFPVGTMDWSARNQIAAMKNERTREFFDLIRQEPGVVQEDLARRVGITAPAAYWHLKRLEEVGMVGRVKKGRKVHYYSNEGSQVRPPADDSPGMEVH